MPQFTQRVPKYTPPKPKEVSWNSFRKGLSSLLNPTEIEGDSLAQSDNLILTGKGIPTKRWGYGTYFMAGATGSVRDIGAYYNGSTKELLALTDWGYLTKKSSASYSMITGASWPSGYQAEMTQLDNKIYITSPQRELVRYDGSTLIGFATIATPTASGISNLSGASGIGDVHTVSYRISAEGRIGETLASTAISLASVQENPENARVRISWAAVSAASGDLTGYVIYGRTPGNETFMYRVGSDALTFEDDGAVTPSTIIEPPTADSTGGPKAKYVARYKDRLIIAGIDNDPTMVMISGPVPNQEKFHWSYGGGWVLIDPDSGEDITGLGVLRDKILVFKERSIWELTLSTVTIGNFTVVDPVYQLLTSSHGCVAHKTIAAVEDDLFFLSRRGVYAVGYKPNLLNVISTTEISARVRDKLDGINPNKWDLASADYRDYKYVLAYPEAGQNTPNKQIIFDRERAAWMGPWTVASNNLFRYYDSTNTEKFVYGSTASPYVFEESSDYATDDGTAISTTLRTRKEDFETWNLFKTMKDVFLQFRDVVGSINVDVFIEDRSGTTKTAKSFSINPQTGNSGWGSSSWANSAQWGDSEESAGGGDLSEILRWVELNDTARAIQLQITSSGGADTYKLLGIKLTSQVQGKGSIPADYRV